MAKIWVLSIHPETDPILARRGEFMLRLAAKGEVKGCPRHDAFSTAEAAYAAREVLLQPTQHLSLSSLRRMSADPGATPRGVGIEVTELSIAEDGHDTCGPLHILRRRTPKIVDPFRPDSVEEIFSLWQPVVAVRGEALCANYLSGMFSDSVEAVSRYLPQPTNVSWLAALAIDASEVKVLAAKAFDGEA